MGLSPSQGWLMLRSAPVIPIWMPGRVSFTVQSMAVFTSLSTLDEERVSPDYSRRSLIGAKLMLSWARMNRGMRAAPHSHPHEQVFWILSGSVEVLTGGQRRVCRAGDIALIPPGAEHEVGCLEDTEFLTVLAPPRVDLAAGAPIPSHLGMRDDAATAGD